MQNKFLSYCPACFSLLFWCALAVVIWGELKPQPSGIEQACGDKLVHFAAYFALSVLGCLALFCRDRAFRAVLYLAAGLMICGGLLEFVQGMVGRDMSLYDELANSLGVVCGTVAWPVLTGLRKRFACSG